MFFRSVFEVKLGQMASDPTEIRLQMMHLHCVTLEKINAMEHLIGCRSFGTKHMC